MAQSFVTTSGTLTIPGAYPQYTVQAAQSGLSTTGVLMVVGEADAGPDYSLETDLTSNSFGPDALADVQAKYKSGNIVDAFLQAVAPANDPDITGSFSRCIVVKTNPSTKASSILLKVGGGTYSTLYDKSYGTLGNLIYYTISETAEVVPTTGAFTWLENINSLNFDLRVNGGAAQSLSLGALTLPSALVTAVNGLSGVTASGGADRLTISAGIVAGGDTLAVGSVSGATAVFTISTAWAVNPVVGDTLFVSSTSVVKGATNKNVGSWVVTAVSNSTIGATKLCDGSGANGALTTPVEAVGAVDIASTTADLRCFAPVTIAITAGNPIAGTGKSLEINELTTGTDLFSNYAYALNTTKVTWVSKTGSAKLLTSATERSVALTDSRQVDSFTETLSTTGTLALLLGYSGTTATAQAVVGTPDSDGNPTTIAITRTNGTGADIGTLLLSQYPTLSDLATFINSKTGYTCKVATALVGQMPSKALDIGTFTFGSDFGSYTGQIKVDAYKWHANIAGNSGLLQENSPSTRAAAGFPANVAAQTYLAGGAKGATTDASFNAAVDACENLYGNFLIPLFSQDASADVTAGMTDSGSTYTIANVQAYCRTHVLKMSTLKRRKNRQAFLSNRGTFAADKTAAANLASFRCSCTFLDVKNVSSTGGIAQYQPWMGAIDAAAMQAAGFYKAIVRKTPNITGFLQAGVSPSDFNDQKDSDVEDALNAGLLPLRRSNTGQIYWVSDQTTYGKDSNFVYNSIQAVYAADTIALTTAQRMELAFVGQSVADVSAAIALSALEGIMSDFLRLKLIAPSDDAPKGFKNASIRISGPAMIVSVEVKLAGAIYFIPISFLVSQVTQSASS